MTAELLPEVFQGEYGTPPGPVAPMRQWPLFNPGLRGATRYSPAIRTALSPDPRGVWASGTMRPGSSICFNDNVRVADPSDPFRFSSDTEGAVKSDTEAAVKVVAALACALVTLAVLYSVPAFADPRGA